MGNQILELMASGVILTVGLGIGAVAFGADSVVVVNLMDAIVRLIILLGFFGIIGALAYSFIEEVA